MFARHSRPGVWHTHDDGHLDLTLAAAIEGQAYHEPGGMVIGYVRCMMLVDNTSLCSTGGQPSYDRQADIPAMQG